MFRKPIVHLPDDYLPAIEQLPGELKWVASVIEEALPGMGVKITLILAQRFNGPVYFRRVDNFIRAWRDDRIRAEYDLGGVTAKVLAVKTGLSPRWVEDILASSGEGELDEKQMRLF